MRPSPFRPASALLLLSLASAASAAPPARRAPRQYTIDQFMAVVRVGGASFSPDEKRILFSSNQSGIFNAWSVPVGGGSAAQLTRSTTDTTYAVSYFPADERILYTRDAGGDENNHLYVRGKDGTERDLTPAAEGKKLKASFVRWSGDDRSFFVRTNERDSRFFDLYRYDAATYARTMVYQNAGGFEIADVSRDGRWVALDKPNTSLDSDVYLYSVASKETKHLTPHQGQVAFSTAAFDPAASALYFLTDEGGEFKFVRRYALASGKFEDVEKGRWDVLYTGFSWNGKYRYTATNEDARTVIKVVDAKTGAPVQLPQLPEGDLTSVAFSRSERLMAFYLTGDRSPANLHVLDLRTGKVTRLTDTLSKDIDPQDLVDAQVVRFKSFDAMEIPNVLLKPHQAAPDAKAPALVWVHGGPGGQTRKGYSALMQYLANHGYVILGINNRGSSGYGKTFYAADDRKHGREPLWDCVEGKKYLASLPYVDPARIGIIGGSYGGYMVLAALTFQPQEFQAGVDIFGVANWVRTLESIPPYWESFRQALYQEIGDPKKDLEQLKAISPLFHADKIRKPLLVLQGANDPRVIKPESDDIVAEVRKNGVPVEYVVFPDEGHGFTKKANETRAWSTVLRFLDEQLKKDKALN
jgi:dipeptidyl aminopeptidase/acylaminoacyl peptidase